MYKILVKSVYKSGDFYQVYQKESEVEGVKTVADFETDDQDALEAEMIELYKTHNTDSIIPIQVVDSEIDIQFKE